MKASVPGTVSSETTRKEGKTEQESYESTNLVTFMLLVKYPVRISTKVDKRT